MPDRNYHSLIRNWHLKAEEDYFARFSFEYLAFIAFVTTQMQTENELIALARRRRATDRDFIQALKQNPVYRNAWLTLIQSPENNRLREDTTALINELRDARLQSDGDWWNCEAFDSTQKNCENPIEGIIVNQEDYVNLVETWYVIRNNLFHGGKNPTVRRDKILVEYGYKTLSRFVGDVLLKSFERRTFSPASWEDFLHRFYKGEAEVVNSTGAAASIYELLNLDDSYFPCVIGDQTFSRESLVEKVNFDLLNSYDASHEEKIARIKGLMSEQDVERYFGETIKGLES